VGHSQPNETVEKVQFSDFFGKTPFENQELMSDDFQVLGFFDSLNEGMQATAYSLRFAALCSGFQPRLMPGVGLREDSEQ
jgi:hypothetical protein